MILADVVIRFWVGAFIHSHSDTNVRTYVEEAGTPLRLQKSAMVVELQAELPNQSWKSEETNLKICGWE
jgi:hypothetical protein